MTDKRHISFAEFHPAPLFLYFILILLVSMFLPNPIILLTSLASGTAFALTYGGISLRDCLFYTVIFLAVTATNPLFSHNGVTPIFFLNGVAVTLEAVAYGANLGVMIVAVMLWCKSISRVMDSNKILFLFGKTLPKIGLVISFTIRLIPMYRERFKKILDIQRATGIYNENLWIDKIKSGAHALSAFVTWALENGVTNIESMKSRGYGLHGRTSFSLYRFTFPDAAFLILCLTFAAVILYSVIAGNMNFYFYPEISPFPNAPSALAGYAAFAVLSFAPAAIELKEKIKWKYYMSKI